MKMWNLRFIAIGNLAAFTGVVVINALANIIPLNGVNTGELSDLYPNLFVPAGLTFSIWALIYLLLTGYVVYGLTGAFGAGERQAAASEGFPWFLISCGANIGWIFAWHWKRPLLSLVVMLILLASLIFFYLRVQSGTKGRAAFLFMRLPVSVYLGWITVATIANITAVLVNFGWKGFGLSEDFWAAVVIAAAVVITLIIILIRADLAYSLVVLWAFAGIIIKRAGAGDSPVVVTAAAAGIAAIVICWILRRVLTH